MIRKAYLNTLVLLRKMWLPIGVTMVVGLVLCIFPPKLFAMQWGMRFVNLIMLSYLGAGLGFLMLRQPRLTYISFACCAILCLYLRHKVSPDSTFRYRFAEATNAPRLKVLHLNTSATDGDIETVSRNILKTNADLVSIQEFTPDWEMILPNFLEKDYPYRFIHTRMDFYGMAIFSKKPLTKVDTFNLNGIPHLIGSIKKAEKYPEVFFIGSHTMPPVNTDAYGQIREQLEGVAQRVNIINAPMIAFGDYNVVPWSSEMSLFREKTGLSDGRREFSLGGIPNDYILFSKHFNCLEFKNIKDTSGTAVGILGNYQLKSDL